MKIEIIPRPTSLLRSVERIVREDDGRIDADAVTLDLDEKRQGKEEYHEEPQNNKERPEARPADSPEPEPKVPLSVVA